MRSWTGALGTSRNYAHEHESDSYRLTLVELVYRFTFSHFEGLKRHGIHDRIFKPVYFARAVRLFGLNTKGIFDTRLFSCRLCDSFLKADT